MISTTAAPVNVSPPPRQVSELPRLLGPAVDAPPAQVVGHRIKPLGRANRSVSVPLAGLVAVEIAGLMPAEAGHAPVREWLKELRREDRKTIGEDIKTAQYGWPIGMPSIRKLEPGRREVRSSLKQGIARVLFTVMGALMVLFHGFIKKSQKTPREDLETARRRLADLRRE